MYNVMVICTRVGQIVGQVYHYLPAVVCALSPDCQPSVPGRARPGQAAGSALRCSRDPSLRKFQAVNTNLDDSSHVNSKLPPAARQAGIYPAVKGKCNKR